MANLSLVYALFALNIFQLCLSQKAKCPQIEDECDGDKKYRSMDGSCNNLEHPKWGMAIRPYNRLLPNTYSDGIHALPKTLSGEELPHARKISIVMDPVNNHTDKEYTLALMQFGQVVTHDMTRLGLFEDIGINRKVECCKVPEFGIMGRNGKDFDDESCAAIIANSDDPIYGKHHLTCGDFPRSLTTHDLDCKNHGKVAEPLTIVSGYLDLSNIYGSNKSVADSLRTKKNGLLKTVTRHGQIWPTQEVGICPQQSQNDPCYKVGDNRVVQSPELAISHLAFYRLHNILAKVLAMYNSHWDDDKLFEEARKINIGFYQNIVHKEYLPRVLGEHYVYKHGLTHREDGSCIPDYDENIDATMLVEFSTCAFRSLHTTTAGTLQLVNEGRKVIGDIRLSDNLEKPSIIEYNNATDGNGELYYDHFVRGFTYQPQDRADSWNVETKHFLFKGSGTLGLDLRSSDIQRGRDHGVGSYVKARKYCNLPVPKSFKDLEKIMPSSKVKKLKSLYEKVEDIELTVGALAEHLVPGALVGETNQCLIRIQFQRTRYGDRFFYENCQRHTFNKNQLNVIRRSTFACVLCVTSYEVEKMQPFAFDLIGRGNHLRPCKEMCTIDLREWREKENHHHCRHK